MDSTKSLAAKKRLFVVFNVVLGAILLSTAVLSSSGKRNQQGAGLPTVKDNSGALQLISQEPLDGIFVMRMQNTSNKAIIAYTKAVCDVPHSTTDYTMADPIEPGEVIEIVLSFRGLSIMCESAKTQPSIQPSITILATVFDDRTYGGDFQWVKGLWDDWRGKKIQLKRINRILAKASKWSDLGVPAMLERLKAEIAALPIDEEESPVVRGGFYSAIQDVLYLLDQLKQWHYSSLTAQVRRNIQIQWELAEIDSIPEGIAKLIALNEKWISRY